MVRTARCPYLAVCARPRRGAGLPHRAARLLTHPADRTPAAGGRVGVGRVFVKDESCRLGLPAFKALGASWAVHRALAERAASGEGSGPVTLVTATDGNHGRAVARTARLLGQRAHVFVPRGVHPRAVAAVAANRRRSPRSRGRTTRPYAGRPRPLPRRTRSWSRTPPGRAMSGSRGGSSRATPPSAPRSTSSWWPKGSPGA
ncbi:pyridoxal-phosphate dependent enzyme [Streptosporangium lutulentum]